MKSDQLNFCLQSVLSGLESEEEADLDITTDGGMHEVANSDRHVLLDSNM